MTTGAQVLAWGLAHIPGTHYLNSDARRLGYQYYDCSGATWRSHHDAAHIDIGQTSWQQARLSGSHGLDGMAIAHALYIAGALLFMGARHGYDGFGDGGHVAMSMGNGAQVLEARGHAYVNGVYNAAGRPWSNAGLMPGISYGSVGPSNPAPHGPPPDWRAIYQTGHAEATIIATGPELRMGQPQNQHCLDWQKALNCGTGTHLRYDGIFGQETWQATRNMQLVMKIPVDGIVGPVTRQKMSYILHLRYP